MKPLGSDASVSVVVAAYNAASFVEAAVESALLQKDVTLDVILVDDASTDTTKTVLTTLAKADPRVVALESPKNGGPAGARNIAFRHAQGTWLAVLDSDDRYQEGRLRLMTQAGEMMHADIVLDDFVSVNEDGDVLPGDSLANQHKAGFITLEDWVKFNSFTKSEISFGYAKPLIRRDFIEKNGITYNETLRNGEDYHLVLEALVAGAKVYFTGQTGYCYTRRAGSVSRRAQKEHMLSLMAADAAVAARLPPSDFAMARQRLAERQRNLKRFIVGEDVLAALKSRRFLAATGALIRNPDAFGRVFGQLAEAFSKRFRPKP